VQRDTITHRAHSTILVLAAFGIIDAIAVADIEAASAAILPDRVLYEPGEGLRKGRVELPVSIRVGVCAADPGLWQGAPILHNMLVGPDPLGEKHTRTRLAAINIVGRTA
jgi:hypothetical protein